MKTLKNRNQIKRVYRHVDKRVIHIVRHLQTLTSLDEAIALALLLAQEPKP